MILRYFKSLSVALGASALLLLAGCGNSNSKTSIPVTTQSESAREIFLHGRELYENLRLGEARELFDLAVENDPMFAQAQFYRSLLPRSLADGQKLRRHALSLSNKVSKGEWLMIEALAGTGRGHPEEAVELLNDLIDLHPGDKRAHLFLGQIYHFRLEDMKSAIKEYKRAIRLDKNYAPPYNLIGYAYSSQEKFRDAEKALNNYIRLIPDEPNPYDSMADLLTLQGELEEANEFFAKAFAANPLFTISQQKRGLNLIFLGNYAEGRSAIRSAIDNEVDIRIKGEYLNSLALSHIFEGNFTAGIESLGEVSALARDSGFDYLLLNSLLSEAVIRIMNGQTEGVASLLIQIDGQISQGGFDEVILDQLRASQVQMAILEKTTREDFESARSLLEGYKLKADEDESGYATDDYHSMAGNLDVETENYNTALEHLEQGHLKEMDLFNMARAYEGLGKTAKAEEYYRKHAQLYNYSLWYALTLPQSREALGRF